VLYDAYPHAILVRNQWGKTPLEILAEKDAEWRKSASANVHFLETQLVYAQQAQDTTAMTTPDENGWLPLHHALKDKASLGSIKLLLEGNLSAIQVASHEGVFPLHIACEFSSVGVFKLLEHDCIPMNRLDKNKDSILHYACRRGNLEVVMYLLTNHFSLLSSAEVNENGELPIYLLCEASKDRVDIADSTEYIEVIWRMLLANPEALMSA